MTNAEGGRQSQTPYGFHLLPTRAIFAAAQVTQYGADKYDETINERNYTKIPPADHINHCIQHLYAYLAGDTSDEHLSHAIVRAMFAFETDLLGKETRDEEVQAARSGSIAQEAGVRVTVGRRTKRYRREGN